MPEGIALASEVGMGTTDETAAALRAVLADADARTCPVCHEQAAVRTYVNNTAAHPNDARTSDGGYVWLCFECGHEEPDRTAPVASTSSPFRTVTA
jgi:hypothetical protein